MKKYANQIILLVMVALVAVSLWAIIPPSTKTKLGLDLQGGLEVVYTATTTDGKTPTQDQLDQTISILDRRVNGLGVSESAIQKQGTDQISVALPGVKDVNTALNNIGKTAQLEFFRDDAQSRPVGPVATKEEALKELAKLGASKAEIAQLTATGNTISPSGYALVVSKAEPATSGHSARPEAWYVYKRPPAMTGKALKDANARIQQTNGGGSEPGVYMDFTSEGNTTFQQITKELYRTGILKRVPQTFAIVLDNQMVSDPMIDYTDPSLSNGISGGAVISGSMDMQEAKDLATILKNGALPVKLEPAYQQQVSATLGKDSLRQGLLAGMLGLGLVLIYMLFYYRFLGLVADLALIVYGILLWGLFSALHVTLTLPGIAGMILTIGVAADANVVIFERIKEEVRHGKTVRSGVSSGYTRGFKTILDANILTLLTAGVLFLFATASPKGFALTLGIGVLVSMLTAILFTRALLGVLAGFTFFSNPAFMGVKASQIETEGIAAGRAATARAAKARRRQAAADESAPVPEVATAGDEAGDKPAKPAPRPSTGSRSSTSRKKKRKRR